MNIDHIPYVGSSDRHSVPFLSDTKLKLGKQIEINDDITVKIERTVRGMVNCVITGPNIFHSFCIETDYDSIDEELVKNEVRRMLMATQTWGKKQKTEQ